LIQNNLGNSPQFCFYKTQSLVYFYCHVYSWKNSLPLQNFSYLFM
jgi:hypothetical protein